MKVKTGLPHGKIAEVMKIDRTSVQRNIGLIKDQYESKRNNEVKKDINNILLITL